MAKKREKWLQFAATLTSVIGEVLSNEDNDHHIDLKEEDLTDFFHALGNAMPTMIYNSITGAGVDQLGFNHVANRLCVQYQNPEGKTKKEMDQFSPEVNHCNMEEEE